VYGTPSPSNLVHFQGVFRCKDCGKNGQLWLGSSLAAALGVLLRAVCHFHRARCILLSSTLYVVNAFPSKGRMTDRASNTEMGPRGQLELQTQAYHRQGNCAVQCLAMREIDVGKAANTTGTTLCCLRLDW
jgi:hypothetical protein